MIPLDVHPPVSSALRLVRAYGAMRDAWFDTIARRVLADWLTNTRAHGPGRLDSAWARQRLRGLEVDLMIPVDEIATTAHEIDRIATRNFKRSIQAAQTLARTDARVRKLLAGSKAKKRLERVGLAPEMGAAVQEFRRRNVALITKLRDDEIGVLGDLLEQGEANGWRVEQLAQAIGESLDVTEARANFYARDQTLKLHADIQEERQTQAGISQYIWRTSGDERVRGTPGGKWPRGMHYDLDGTVQDWSDPPITNEAGDRNHPGQDYQCRCVAIPVLPDLLDLAPDDEA